MALFSSLLSHLVKNASAAFMSIVNNIFLDYSGIFMRAYLDDILIYGQSGEEHINHGDIVVRPFLGNNLYAQLSKSIFGAKEVEYLGFVF